MYSLAVEKRGLIAYDDKRVLLANLENGEPNPYTHAYGHYSLVNDIQVQEAEEHPEAGNDLHSLLASNVTRRVFSANTSSQSRGRLDRFGR